MKPDKPEDRDETWLRKMSERISRRTTPDDVKVEADEADEPEDEQEPEARSGPRSAAPISRKKKRKKHLESVWIARLVIVSRWVMLGLAIYGLWRLAS